jgi:hypothetical protein
MSIETIEAPGAIPIPIGHDIELRWSEKRELHSIQDLRTGVVWDTAIRNRCCMHRQERGLDYATVQ